MSTEPSFYKIRIISKTAPTGTFYITTRDPNTPWDKNEEIALIPQVRVSESTPVAVIMTNQMPVVSQRFGRDGRKVFWFEEASKSEVEAWVKFVSKRRNPITERSSQ